MPEVFVKMDTPVREFLKRMLRGIYESLNETGRPRGYCPDAEDDQEFWVDGLRSDNLEALETLLNFVKNENFGMGTSEIAQEDLFAIMRACSCIRLHLRETALKGISDEVLENPGAQLDILKGPLNEVYVVYSVLAYIQTAAVEASSSL